MYARLSPVSSPIIFSLAFLLLFLFVGDGHIFMCDDELLFCRDMKHQHVSVHTFSSAQIDKLRCASRADSKRMFFFFAVFLFTLVFMSKTFSDVVCAGLAIMFATRTSSEPKRQARKIEGEKEGKK